MTVTSTEHTGADIGRKRRWGEISFQATVRSAGFIPVVIVVSMVILLTADAWLSITTFGLDFVTSRSWNPVTRDFGALPAIYGTIASSILALVIAVPVSVGVAVFLVEFSPRWLSVPAGFMVEILASVPSVVFGLWALFVMVPKVRDPLQLFLQDYLGFLPIFEGAAIGIGLLSAGIILSIMIIPIITAITRDVLAAVPREQREAALGLGATRWETTWAVVLPHARSGIVGAVMLGLGRAIGETMAVLMVIGNAYKISPSLFAPSHTLASTIAAEFREAADDLYRSSLIELGLVLLVVTLAINVAARLLIWRISQHSTGAMGGG